MGYFLQFDFFKSLDASGGCSRGCVGHCTNNLTARLTLRPASRYFQAAGAHPLPDADSVRGASLTTKDGEPMTMHVWSAVLTILVVVPIHDRRFDRGHAAIVARALSHLSSRNVK
jgi:hypothetical protein